MLFWPVITYEKDIAEKLKYFKLNVVFPVGFNEKEIAMKLKYFELINVIWTWSSICKRYGIEKKITKKLNYLN